MQYAKDSFYMALRSRLAILAPSRTILIRGALRPGILVEEAEAPFTQIPADVFILKWLGTGTDLKLPAALTAAECDISYRTMGTQAFGGLDRGRMLSGMDSELLSILTPPQTPKLNYLVTPPAAMLTQVFWEEPVFGPLVSQNEVLSRSVTVRVYSYSEEGE